MEPRGDPGWLTATVLDDTALTTALGVAWGWPTATVTPHDAGMNSRTWWVDHRGARHVAKWVPAEDAGHLLAGVAAAGYVASAGLRTGPCRRTRDEQESLEVAGGVLVVLTLVHGRELTGEDPGDDLAIGRTLAVAHRATLGRRADGAWEFPWVDPGAPHLAIDEDVRGAVRDAVDAVAAIPPDALTQGICHGDPAPECFLLDGLDVGLIDWGSCVNGPLLYDLASAAMYLGGLEYAAPMLTAYSAAGGPVPEAEVRDHAATFLRWRWANQADYFAGRIAGSDRTGQGEDEADREGFRHARDRLLG